MLSIPGPEVDLNAMMQGMRELEELGRLDPLAAWMAEQGFDSQDGALLALPTGDPSSGHQAAELRGRLPPLAFAIYTRPHHDGCP